MFKVCWIIEISKIEFLNFSGTERSKRQKNEWKNICCRGYFLTKLQIEGLKLYQKFTSSSLFKGYARICNLSIFPDILRMRISQNTLQQLLLTVISFSNYSTLLKLYNQDQKLATTKTGHTHRSFIIWIGYFKCNIF